MKTVKHSLSILLSVLMLLSCVPGALLPVLPGLLPEPPVAEARSGESLEVDYENVSTGTLADAIRSDVNYVLFTAKEDDYKVIKQDVSIWRHTNYLSAYADDNTGLRRLLQSTSIYDTYISLTGDADCNPKNGAIDPIVITTNKVLDLNGYSITMRDDTNVAKNKGQALDPDVHRSRLFEITNGARLTIIDSSRWRYNRFGKGGDETGTGKIKMTARIVYPFGHDITTYTIRDLFWVLDGTLVTYGGTYQAGRQKYQHKKNFSWSKLKTVIGTAVELGVNVASYATGVDMAVAAQRDLTAGFKNAAINEAEDDGGEDLITSTKKRTGGDAPAEPLEASSGGDREKSVGEKSSDATAGNASGSAKKENTQMAEARKNVTNNATNQSAIGKMVDGVFNLVSGIKSMIGSDYGSRVSATIMGTAVHLGTDGTFVCYGGNFIGYGSTPHTRDAVVEVTLGEESGSLIKNENTGKWLGGHAYIYGGTFEGYCGANIFNFVKNDSTPQPVEAVNVLDSGSKNYNTYNLKITETNGLRILYDVGGSPVSTKNVTVRGGTFRNYYELMMVAVREQGSDQHFSKFPGTPGGLGLGVESFGEDMIKDGRIQICDKYGDGNLVLMDETKHPGEKVYHYRLLCSDLELRYKQYIQVSPNQRVTNTTHTFHLVSVTSDQEDVSTGWESTDGNERTGAFNQTETVFSYPLDSVATGTYYVIPELDAQNSSGAGIESSNIWYYADPVSTDGIPVNRLFKVANLMYCNRKDGSHYAVSQEEVTDKTWESNRAAAEYPWYRLQKYFYHSNVKWFTYRVYRVDPLTRQNISESAAYGSDKPLCELVYGVSSDSLKCKITLSELEKHMKKTVTGFTGYKPGEMYRITLTMEEYFGFDLKHYNNSYNDFPHTFGTNLPVATATSSILFKCYSVAELQDLDKDLLDVDYTALQWDTEPALGQYASVSIVNGLAGKVDYLDRKIFDVYYQWYSVHPDGKETLIAGTDNIYTGAASGKAKHTYEYWNVGKDGKTYVNTVDPNDPNASKYTWNGLPKDKKQWNYQMLHAYTHEMCTTSGILKADSSRQLSMANNLATATNTDRCYIPASLKGMKVYCKVTVVNTYWQKEFDHIQVFYSHPVQLPGEVEPDVIVPTVNVSYKSGSRYISAADPATIRVGRLDGLHEGELVTRVTYMVNGRPVTYSHLGATKGNEIPAPQYPQDFYPPGYDCSRLKAGDIKCYCFITTTEKRGDAQYAGKEYGYYSDKTKTFRFDVKVDSLRFAEGTPEEITLPLTAKDDKTALKNALQAYYSPENATYGVNYFKAGETFGTTNAAVATLDDTGTLKLGGSTGTADITLNSPDGSNQKVTVNVTQTVGHIEVFGIDAPEVGKKFDRTADVPEDAPYFVTDLRWIDMTDNGKELAPDAVAQDYHYYTVEVDVQPEDYVVVPDSARYLMRLGARDGGEMAVDGSDSACRIAVDRAEDGEVSAVHYKYTYSFVSGGNMGSVIRYMFLDFPTEVKEGTYLDDWKDQIKIETNLEDGVLEDLTISVRPRAADGANDILDALGYPHLMNRVLRFIKGVQNGMVISVNLPEGVTFSGDFKFHVNGKLYPLNSAGNSYGDTYLSADVQNSITVVDGTPLTPFALSYYVKDFNLCVNGLGQDAVVHLNEDLRGGVDASDIWLTGAPVGDGSVVRYAESWDAIDLHYGRVRGLYDAVKAAAQVRLRIYAQADVDGDHRADLVFDHTVLKQIYDGTAPAPVPTDTHSFTVRVMNPDGTVYNTQTGYADRILFNTLSLPAGSMVKRIINGKGTEYAFDYTGKLTFPAGDTSALLIVETEQASCGTLNVGSDEVVASPTLPNLLFSSDAVHWTAANRLTGFTPDGDHVIYYKQCVQGEVYTSVFNAAAVTYGVWVGDQAVTDKNCDLLAANHWKYDPATKTLTIEDLLLADTCKDNAMIRSLQDLTIVVKGDNFFEGSGKGYGIRVDGDLTLEGSGNMRFNEVNTAVLVDKLLSVKGSGFIKITNTRYGLHFDGQDGVADFINGSLEMNPYTVDGNTYGDLLWGPGAAATFKNNYHPGDPLIIETLTSYGYRQSLTEEEFNDLSRDAKYLYYYTRHYGQKTQIPTREYFAGVSCTESPEYYYRCNVCGSVTPDYKYTATVSSHDLVHVPDQAPGCYTAGWKDYAYCTKCSYTTITVLPATGHTWKDYGSKAPTCSEPGTPEYRVCTTCGASTQGSALQNRGGDLLWSPTPHNVVPVTGVAATCSKAGSKSHYECTMCKQSFADADAKHPLTAAQVAVPKQEHEYGDWKIVKQPTATTEGTVECVCRLCGAKQTEKIAPLAPSYKLGDVDADGEITAADARLALRRAVDLETYAKGSKEFLACDVDKDNEVTAADARKILRAAVDLEDPKTW